MYQEKKVHKNEKRNQPKAAGSKYLLSLSATTKRRNEENIKKGEKQKANRNI